MIPGPALYAPDFVTDQVSVAEAVPVRIEVMNMTRSVISIMMILVQMMTDPS